MIVNPGNSGSGEGGIRDVVFRLALIEDPNNERVAANFANRVNVGPTSPLPGLNTGGSSGPSMGPSAGGYTGRTGGGTTASTGLYSEDMKRINEARKAAEDLITKMRVEAERKIGEERKRALEVVAKLEEEAAKKINEQKKRYDDEEQRRREKSFRDQLKWNEMVRQEREKQLRAEGAAYASRVEAGQSASYRRMGLYLQNQEDSNGRSRGSYRELIENATQLVRAVVLLGVASEDSTKKIMKTLALMEAGSSAVRGTLGVTNQLSEIAMSGGARGMAGTIGLGALAVGGAALGINSIYEQVSGKSGGWNDALGTIYAQLDDQYLGGALYGNQGTQKTGRMQFQRDRRKQLEYETMQRNTIAYGREREQFYYPQTVRDTNGFDREMDYRNAVFNGRGVSDANANLASSVVANSRVQGQANIDTLQYQMQGYRNLMASGTNTPEMDAKYRNEILIIEKKIEDARRNQTTIAIQGLEQIRRARLEEENSIRQMAQDKRASFGMLDRQTQSDIVRAKQKLDSGMQLSRQEEQALMQYGGKDTNQVLRNRQNERADVGGFSTFMREFEIDASNARKLADDVEKVIQDQFEEIKKIASVSAKEFTNGFAVFFKQFNEETQKLLNEKGFSQKAKSASVPK